MGPGEDELHALPAQQFPLAQEAKDLDLEEFAERAAVPGRQRVPGTAGIPSSRCYKRVQVWMEPYLLAECVLDNRHRRLYARSYAMQLWKLLPNPLTCIGFYCRSDIFLEMISLPARSL